MDNTCDKAKEEIRRTCLAYANGCEPERVEKIKAALKELEKPAQ